ncbi:GTP 3',8-cyclase MoaA [Salinimonas sp. HHU 13199]|uniref:GTP 3',8-cyclase n=1 Tax=Salinimonas profundi TaxID=2729140 RepID=A0ABR8LFP1_9ALTE|nr:GTP 3',8-cyclase MoaA [Salinimonas profundi]MBD3585078.1 GTP 3',8-cyclase MoaA [Salinimonas profundi]
MLEDSYGRRFHYLRLSITEACNFRCQYCLPDGYDGPPNSAFLQLGEIQTLITAFAQMGTSKVRITGGEPSLRRDFCDVIHHAATTPGIRRVATTTHGARLYKDARKWADAGLDQVNVSIDSLDPNQFASITGQDKLQQILKGIDIAVEAGIKVKINTVLLQDFNANRLTRFLSWLKDTPVTLRFIELMETGDHHDFFSRQHVSGEPIRQRLISEGWQPLLRAKDAGPAQEFYHPDFAGQVGLIMPYSKDFCKSCNRLRVAANGKLHLCLFSEQGLELRPYLAEGDVEGVKQFITDSLADKKVSHFLQEGHTGATKHLAMLGG